MVLYTNSQDFISNGTQVSKKNYQLNGDLQYFCGTHTEYELALRPSSALTEVDVNGSTSICWELDS